MGIFTPEKRKELLEQMLSYMPIYNYPKQIYTRECKEGRCFHNGKRTFSDNVNVDVCVLSRCEIKVLNKLGIDYCYKLGCTDRTNNYQAVFQIEMYLLENKLTYKQIKGNTEEFKTLQSHILTKLLKEI